VAANGVGFREWWGLVMRVYELDAGSLVERIVGGADDI
jgi:hypothetical protein